MKADRRAFLKALAMGAAGAPAILSSGGVFRNAFGDVAPSAARLKGRVAVASDPRYSAFDGDPGPALDAGMCSLTDASKPSDAWKLLFSASDVVAVKVNALAGRSMSPGWSLVEAVVKRLQQAGVQADRIIVWDRSSRELRRAGYPVSTSDGAVRVFGTDSLEGGYESEIATAGSVVACFSKILTRHCTAFVNVGVLKDHDIAGVSVALKNLYGVIHNPNKYHGGNCSPFAAHIAGYAAVRDKTRLNIADAPVGQYQGGPAFNGGFLFEANSVLLATDAVALDRVGLDMLENKRKEKGLRSLKEERRHPAYIEEAGRMGLGEADISAIRRMDVKAG